MFTILGNMNGEWFPNGEHISEEQAKKIADRLTDETGHFHIVVNNLEGRIIYGRLSADCRRFL